MKVISQILVVAIINLACTYSYAWVDPTATTVVIHKKSIAQIYRHQLIDMTDRQEVVDQLILYGVSKEEAINRINSLTDEEIEAYFANIDQLSSGGQQGGYMEAVIFFIVFSPVLAIMAMGWVGIKVTASIACLFHFDEYQYCFENFEYSAGLANSTPVKETLAPSQGASCLEPCYSDFNDCMDSSHDAAEENQCNEEKTLCVQQCQGNFN